MQSKILPHSDEDEKSMLATLLIDIGESENYINLVDEDCFYSTKNKELYNAIRLSLKQAKTIDFPIIARLFPDISYVQNIMDKHPVSVNEKYTARKLKDYDIKRRFMAFCASKYEEVSSGVISGKKSVDDAIQELMGYEIKGKGEPKHISKIMPDIIKDIEKLEKGEKPYQGIMSNLKNLDRITNGFKNSDLIIIAARPSMGKTALVMNIATNIARDENKTVLVFSLEMSEKQLVHRISCSESRVNSVRLSNGEADREDIQRFKDTSSMVESYPLIIDDKGNQSIEDIRRKAYEAKKKHDVKMIIIDYLQIMKLPSAERMDLKVGIITAGLKGIAKSLDIPVVALSQLNRALESRNNKRPIMSDLRESGYIEQDADVIMFIYRDEVYNPESKDIGKAEIDIAKNRNGPTSRAYLKWTGKYTRFDNLTTVNYGE
jgi:replicative DNA helicase